MSNMKTSLASKNWERGTTYEVLENIHEVEINIALFDRDIALFQEEAEVLIGRDTEFRAGGELDSILSVIDKSADLQNCPLIKQDISTLLQMFESVSGAKDFRLLLATVRNNMCRKFHTDINDLRMLCTYAGPGTLWIREDDLESTILDSYENGDDVLIKESRIQQADTGSVIILKGAIYPKEGAKAILHRSPTIEESGEKRLLLRIDTDEFANF